MTFIRELSEFAAKYAELAEAKTTPVLSKLEIVKRLELANSLIDQDLGNIKQNEERLRADQADPSYPDESRGQLGMNLKRYEALLEFVSPSRRGMYGLEEWLENALSKLRSIAAVPDIDDRQFLRALRAHFTTLTVFIGKEKGRLAQAGIRLDIAELYSLAMIRKIIGQQIDAISKTPTDAASILKSVQ